MFTKKNAEENQEILRQARLHLRRLNYNPLKSFDEVKFNTIKDILASEYPDIASKRIENAIYKAIRQFRYEKYKVGK